MLSRSNGQLITCDEIFRLTADGEFYVSPASKSSIAEMFGVQPSGNIFKRNGKGDWTVAFGGDSMPVKHVSGLSYIAILLGSPGIDFQVQDLDERVTGVNSAHTKGTSDPLSTQEAIRKIEERLEDARDELRIAERNNDLGTIEARQREIDELEQEKRRSTGLGGKIRTATNWRECVSERQETSKQQSIPSANKTNSSATTSTASLIAALN